MSDANKRQVGGNHYEKLKIQPWDAMQAWSTHDEFCAYLKLTAIKYLARDKNGLEDVQKAAHYLEKLIEVTREDLQKAAHSFVMFDKDMRDKSAAESPKPEGGNVGRAVADLTRAALAKGKTFAGPAAAPGTPIDPLAGLVPEHPIRNALCNHCGICVTVLASGTWGMECPNCRGNRFTPVYPRQPG